MIHPTKREPNHTQDTKIRIADSPPYSKLLRKPNPSILGWSSVDKSNPQSWSRTFLRFAHLPSRFRPPSVRTFPITFRLSPYFVYANSWHEATSSPMAEGPTQREASPPRHIVWRSTNIIRGNRTKHNDLVRSNRTKDTQKPAKKTREQ